MNFTSEHTEAVVPERAGWERFFVRHLGNATTGTSPSESSPK